VKRHAKASSAGSISGQASRFGSKLLLACAMVIFAALVLGVALAAAAIPTVSVENASEVTATSAKAKGTIDPQDHETSYHFEYATQADFSDAASFGSGGSLAEGSGPQQVTATAAELGPNATYYLRLVASNEDGVSTAVAVSTFTTDAIAPTVGNPGHTQFAQSEVIIAGAANPHNSAVSDCRFEYGADDSYGQSIPCEALPPTNNNANLVRAKLSDLIPGASYHFLLSVTNGVGTTESADAVLVARAALSLPACPNAGSIGVGFLPNCRAWEMVSFPSKNGGGVTGLSSRTRAAFDGSAVQYMSLNGFVDVVGMGVSTDYIAKRSTSTTPGDNGWSTHAITPPQEAMSTGASLTAGEPRYEGTFSADLRTGIFSAWSPLTPAPNVALATNLYLRDDLLSPGAGSYRLLTDSATPINQALAQQGDQGRPWLVGTSTDLSHGIFESILGLVSGISANTKKLYEWNDGALRVAGILPTAIPATRSIGGRGVSVGGGGKHTSHAITADGSRIFFTTPSNSSAVTGPIYARINGRSTVQLNASERTIPAATKAATYWDASTDGSRVFFTSEAALTDSAPDSSAAKLYMWEKQPTDEQQSVAVDATGGEFTLTFQSKTTSPIAFDATAAQVQVELEALETIKAGNVSVSGGPGSVGAANPYIISFTGDFAGANVAQIAADGSALTGGASTATATTTQPVKNLNYLNEDEELEDLSDGGVLGVIGTGDDGRYVYFIARSQLVPGQPKLNTESGIYLWHDGEIVYVGKGEMASAGDSAENVDGAKLNLVPRQSRVTPDGRHLLFSSSSGKGLLSVRGGDDYDQTPLSCHTGGLLGCREHYLYSADIDELVCVSCRLSEASATGSSTLAAAGSIGASQTANYLGRSLTDDGHFVFFNSTEKLVEADTNGVSDAYVYNVATGTPHLLSSGESATPSFFLDASADGADAFFVTSEPLSGWDVDGAYDLYDARIGGGFPEPPPPPPSCQGDACQPTPANITDPTPASSSFQGSGNQSQGRERKVRCAKGQRKIKSRKAKSRCAKSRKSKRNVNSHRRPGR
jgi:hypothetical protein